MRHKFFSEFMRDIIFGVEDGLISILGLVVGVAQATSSRSSILIAALAGTVAAAISMAAGDYLSTKSELEVMESQKNKKALKHIHPMASAMVIGFAFIIMSAIPIFPFIVLNPDTAIGTSIALTTIALFITGASKCTITKRNWIVSGLEMVIVAGMAAGAGYMIGSYFAI